MAYLFHDVGVGKKVNSFLIISIFHLKKSGSHLLVCQGIIKLLDLHSSLTRQE